MHRVYLQYDQSASAASTFSKASFVATAGDNDVDINDPDFWKKIGLRRSTMESELSKVRQRKQVERYEASVCEVYYMRADVWSIRFGL